MDPDITVILVGVVSCAISLFHHHRICKLRIFTEDVPLPPAIILPVMSLLYFYLHLFE